jgi:hypothetical protein
VRAAITEVNNRGLHLATKVSPEQKRALRHLAADLDLTHEALVMEALSLLLVKHGRPRLDALPPALASTAQPRKPPNNAGPRASTRKRSDHNPPAPTTLRHPSEPREPAVSE